MYRLGHLARVIIYVGIAKNIANKEGVVKKLYSMLEGIADDPFS